MISTIKYLKEFHEHQMNAFAAKLRHRSATESAIHVKILPWF